VLQSTLGGTIARFGDSMSALPDWMIPPLTAADYEALPEELCRDVEVIDGAIIVNPAPRRPHQTIIGELFCVLKQACGPKLKVDFDVDLRLRDVPLLNRRPDVVVYDRTLDYDAVLRPEQCLLVVEVMSPGSITTDKVDKPAEYATAGIEHFWRVENPTDDPANLSVHCHRLDPSTGRYAVTGVHTGKLSVTEPLSVTVDLMELL
jgi:Uma2 family endonuclease